MMPMGSAAQAKLKMTPRSASAVRRPPQSPVAYSRSHIDCIFGVSTGAASPARSLPLESGSSTRTIARFEAARRMCACGKHYPRVVGKAAATRAGMRSGMTLLNIPLQHREQLPQLPPPFRRVLSALDAVMGVGMNQLFSQRFQPAPGGDDLRQDFRAISIFGQHLLHGVELADDFAHSHNRGAAFLFGMVMVVFGHA